MKCLYVMRLVLTVVQYSRLYTRAYSRGFICYVLGVVDVMLFYPAIVFYSLSIFPYSGT